ncbi:putative beta-lactamase [Mycobacterium sp. MAC_080597_8934]|nr:putative beta-lactamase [Mycobacterium sp. MAC_080597_8934]
MPHARSPIGAKCPGPGNHLAHPGGGFLDRPCGAYLAERGPAGVDDATCVAGSRIDFSRRRFHNHLQAGERRDRRAGAAGRRGDGRPRWQGGLPPGVRFAQARRRTRAGRGARTRGADDRGHDLRPGVADQVPGHRGGGDAALRTGQGRVRRSRAEVSARLQHHERSPAHEGDDSHAADEHVGRGHRRQPAGSVGAGRTRQGRGHPSRAHHAAAVGTRRGVPLLRHQLPAARRAAREDHRRGRGRLRAAPRVRAARHARHPVSSAGQGVRPAYHPGSRDRLGAERRADDGVPRMDLAHNTFAAHRADCT